MSDRIIALTGHEVPLELITQAREHEGGVAVTVEMVVPDVTLEELVCMLRGAGRTVEQVPTPPTPKPHPVFESDIPIFVGA